MVRCGRSPQRFEAEASSPSICFGSPVGAWRCSFRHSRIHLVATGWTPAPWSRLAGHVADPSGILKDFRRQFHGLGRIKTTPPLQVRVPTRKEAIRPDLPPFDLSRQFPSGPQLRSHDTGVDPAGVRLQIVAPCCRLLCVASPATRLTSFCWLAWKARALPSNRKRKNR